MSGETATPPRGASPVPPDALTPDASLRGSLAGAAQALFSAIGEKSREACFLELAIAVLLAADYFDGAAASIPYTWELVTILGITRLGYTLRRIFGGKANG